MNSTQITLISSILFLFASCGTNHKLIGLWQIEKVKVGTQEMTPIARWTRIHKDHTQESGNGWFQHSIGNWEYHGENNNLTIVNSNGFIDDFGAFKLLSISDQKMLWSRDEGTVSMLSSHLRKLKNYLKLLPISY